MAVLTDRGEALVFQARALFERFRATTQHRSELQAKLPEGCEWSQRLSRCCATQYGRRDHHRDAAVKHVAQWLLAQDVGTVYVGDLTDVLSTHWSARVNEQTHNFWSHRQLVDRLADTFAVAGLDLEEVDEAGTSSVCPGCGEQVHRAGDLLQCQDCGLETHADIAGAANLLAAQTEPDASTLFRPMASSDHHLTGSRGSLGAGGPLPTTLDGRGTETTRSRTFSGTTTSGHPHNRCVREHSRRCRSTNEV
jgi:putative transposase